MINADLNKLDIQVNNKATKREEWHRSEGNIIVPEDSSDWRLAEQYRKQHLPYYKHLGSIKEVWRDKDGFLCVQYVSDIGEPLNWFHYTIEDNEISWW